MNPLKLEERVLFIINDNTIHGSIRFQKYGFLLHKQYQRELLELGLSYDGFTFYEDWKPYHYGPYSEQLQKDITDCIDNNLVNKIPPNTNVRYNSYKLTLKGRVRWREFLKHTPDEIKRINNKIVQLQSMYFYDLIKQIYNAYPNFTEKSKIANTLD